MSDRDVKPRIIRKAALAYFEDKKILMGRDNKNDTVFIMIGGKIEEGETDKAALIREVKEELDVEVVPNSINFLKEFSGPAHGHNKDEVLLKMSLFSADIRGKPKTSEEIVEIKYFDSSVGPKHLSEITYKTIFPWLKSQGYIN